jgi:hypothetical protein
MGTQNFHTSGDTLVTDIDGRAGHKPADLVLAVVRPKQIGTIGLDKSLHDFNKLAG